MAAYRRVYDSVTSRLTAKNRDQLRNLGLRSVIEYGLYVHIFRTILADTLFFACLVMK